MSDGQRFNVPKEFTILGHTYEVKFDNDYCAKQNTYGVVKNGQDIVYLASEADGELLAPKQVEATFWHEVTHAVLFRLGYRDYSNDETFVEALSGAIHQVVMTMK